jgi:transcriptional regulator GlxA family with amidase domain
MTQTRIAIGIWDGVEELDFAGPFEVLTAWAMGYDDHDVSVVTVAEEAGPVRCAHGLRVVPDTTWSELGRPDVVVLPGGGHRTQLQPHVLDRLRGFASEGTLMTSVCTGALVLAAAGLLDNRPATTHWSALESLGEAGEGIEVRPDARFVDSGEVVTAAGVSAGIDMALHLVERLGSAERSAEIRRYIQYEPAAAAA